MASKEYQEMQYPTKVAKSQLPTCQRYDVGSCSYMQRPLSHLIRIDVVYHSL